MKKWKEKSVNDLIGWNNISLFEQNRDPESGLEENMILILLKGYSF